MKRFGLIGHPLKNSFSAKYFNHKFEKLGLDAVYQNFELSSIEELHTILHTYPDLCGLNITIPYKESVIPFLHEIDPVAQQIGAVNTLKVEANQYLIGYNTDYIGFEKSILPLLKPWHINALVLGSGGASKAVIYALNKLGIKTTIVSRNPEFGVTYDDLDKAFLRAHQVVVNTTPLGMFPNTEHSPPIPYQYITNLHLAYDLIYLPEKTSFLTQCEDSGATIKNGLQMLEIQAENAWNIWQHP